MGQTYAKDDLLARGDSELAGRLLADREIQRAIERFEKETGELGARRQLLGTAMRLSPDMAPDVHAIMAACRETLAIATPVETYVYPSSTFNAAAVRPENGLLLVMLSSSLLEAFEPDELKFVIGHELGHHLFDHHRIPVGALLGGQAPVGAALALQLFAWQRYAEISSDRAGIACAGRFEPAAYALFKLSSGLRGGRVRILIDKFVEQVADLQTESARGGKADDRMRADWFSSHPFSPLRLKAADLFVKSEIMLAGGMTRAALEAGVDELMQVMDPSYLQDRSEAAEAMRRLLFAGAVMIAGVKGEMNKRALTALEELLGPGSVPPRLNVDAVAAELEKRVENVNMLVPAARRAQIIRDLCVIARADGVADDAELATIQRIGKGLGVDPAVVPCTMAMSTELD